FADRFIYQILPPLRAGMIVLADRYVYTAFARDVARGVHPDWVRGVYRVAPRPHVFFPRADRRLARAPAGRTIQAQVLRGRDGRGIIDRPGRKFPPLPRPRARNL